MDNKIKSGEGAGKRPSKKTVVIIIAALVALALIAAGVIAIINKVKYSPVASDETMQKTVMTVGGYEVPYEVFRYFYLNYADTYADAGLSASELDALAYEKAVESVKGVYASVKVGAEYDVDADDKDITAAANLTVQNTIDEYGRDKYLEELEKNHLTDSAFRFLMAVDEIEATLYKTLTDGIGLIETDDEKILAAIKGDDFIRTVQIFISNDKGDDIEENRAVAERVSALLNEGEDFNSLVGKYSEDYTMTTDGYYFTRLDMIDEYEKAAFALAENQTSGVVETEVGFHIIKRLPKEDEYITEHFDELKSQYLNSKFYSILEDEKNSMSISKSKFFDTLNSDTIK